MQIYFYNQAMAYGVIILLTLAVLALCVGFYKCCSALISIEKRVRSLQFIQRYEVVSRLKYVQKVLDQEFTNRSQVRPPDPRQARLHFPDDPIPEEDPVDYLEDRIFSSEE